MFSCVKHEKKFHYQGVWSETLGTGFLATWLALYRNKLVSCMRYKLACAYKADSNLLHIHTVWSVCLRNPWALSYPYSTYQTLWSDYADGQADLSLQWVYMPTCTFCWGPAQVLLTSRANCCNLAQSSSRSRQNNNLKWPIHWISTPEII